MHARRAAVAALLAAATVIACSSDSADDKAQSKPISGTTTVLSYAQPAKDVDLTKEASVFAHPVWSVLEVKVCVAAESGPVTVSQGPWAVGFPDDTRAWRSPRCRLTKSSRRKQSSPTAACWVRSVSWTRPARPRSGGRG